jgi:threonine dehydratase
MKPGHPQIPESFGTDIKRIATMVQLDNILEASRVIDPVFLNTPIFSSHTLDNALGCNLFVKIETQNPIGSFKGRGTEFFVQSSLKSGEKVVAASAGNFGQGLARAATKRSVSSVIFAATTANPLKIDAMRRLGGEVIQEGADFDGAKAAAKLYAQENKLRFVEDGREDGFAEGAGTIGLEIATYFQSTGTKLDTVLVPLGNGALLAGVACALRYKLPNTKIIAVIARGAPSMKLSLEAKRVIEKEAKTIADGIAVRVPIPESLDTLADAFDVIEEVEEEDILKAIKLIARHVGVIVEPAGAVGVAAILSNPEKFTGQGVATILCGRNISPSLLDQVLVP